MTHQTDSAVVFFSRDGNTRRGAEILCQRLGGRLVELKERRPGNALHALLRMKTPLDGDPWAQIACARCVFLMCPIWARTCVPAMNAFADGADFTDKDVYIVTFQQAVNPRLSYREHQHLAGIVAKNHGSVRECYALVGAKMGRFAGEESIRAQIDTVKLPEDAQETAGAEDLAVAEGNARSSAEQEPYGAAKEIPEVPEAPEEAPAETAEEVPEPQAPEEAPAGTVEEEPEPEAPEEAPTRAVEEEPEPQAPEEAPAGVVEEVPESQAPEEAPAGTVEEVPEPQAPEEAPAGTAEEVPEPQAPEEAPAGAVEEEPEERCLEVLEKNPEEPLSLF